jgi:molybdenum cofactor cytidylyltransferase
VNAVPKIPVFGVIILGAGASSRMGRPKLLLPWGDTSVVGQLIRQWCELGAVQIAIVQRPEDAKLATELDRLNFPAHDRIVNSHPERGMFSSICCAANWTGWNKAITHWVIVLGDQPHLQLETLRALLIFQGEHSEAICQPVFDGHGRHPVLLPHRAFTELKHTPSKTLKQFLEQTPCPLVKLSSDDARLSLDLDTPEDYKRAKLYLNGP